MKALLTMAVLGLASLNAAAMTCTPLSADAQETVKSAVASRSDAPFAILSAELCSSRHPDAPVAQTNEVAAQQIGGVAGAVIAPGTALGPIIGLVAAMLSSLPREVPATGAIVVVGTLDGRPVRATFPQPALNYNAVQSLADQLAGK